MYENLRLPSDPTLRQIVINALSFRHNFKHNIAGDVDKKLKRKVEDLDDQYQTLTLNHKKSKHELEQVQEKKNEIPVELQEEIFKNIFDNLSYTENLRILCQLQNQVLAKALIAKNNEIVEEFTIFKKVKKQYTLKQYLDNPFINFDTSNYDRQLKLVDKYNIGRKLFMVLLVMLHTGAVDEFYIHFTKNYLYTGKYSVQNISSEYKLPIKFYTLIDRFLKSDAPDQKKYAVQLNRDIAEFEIGSEYGRHYVPMVIGIVKLDSLLYPLIYFDIEKQYTLYESYLQAKQQGRVRYEDINKVMAKHILDDCRAYSIPTMRAYLLCFSSKFKSISAIFDEICDQELGHSFDVIELFIVDPLNSTDYVQFLNFARCLALKEFDNYSKYNLCQKAMDLAFSSNDAEIIITIVEILKEKSIETARTTFLSQRIFINDEKLEKTISKTLEISDESMAAFQAWRQTLI